MFGSIGIIAVCVSIYMVCDRLEAEVKEEERQKLEREEARLAA